MKFSLEIARIKPIDKPTHIELDMVPVVAPIVIAIVVVVVAEVVTEVVRVCFRQRRVQVAFRVLVLPLGQMNGNTGEGQRAEDRGQRARVDLC